MRLLLVAAATAALSVACAPESDKTNPAIATDATVAEREASAPAAGASSFTEGQARDRIVAAGYSDVVGLMKADDGAWHGSAMMNGQSTAVVVDYQGNVTAKPMDTAPAMASPPATMPPTETMPAQPVTPAPTTP